MLLARDVNILDHLPPILHDIKELKRIAEIENPSLDDVWVKVEAVLENQFILTSDENGIARYERMLKLSPGGTETLETRRFRVMARYQEQAPYTWRILRQLLDSILGEGKYELTRNVAEKWLKVKLELTVGRQFEVVEMLLERVTPLNMILTVELRYNQWSTIKNLTWGDLKTRTWREVKEEVI